MVLLFLFFHKNRFGYSSEVQAQKNLAQLCSNEYPEQYTHFLGEIRKNVYLDTPFI